MPAEDQKDSGVRIGGDGYGGVTIATKPVRRKRMSLRSMVISGSLSGVVLIGSGVLWALPNYAASTIRSVDAGTTGSAPRGALNILLVGVDKRDDLTRRQQNRLHLGREAGQRSDTMMLIHLSEDHHKVTVVSLPRDTWIDIPGKGAHKINSAYQYGGAKLAVRTVEQATGLRINHYVEVNVLGFIDVVDSLGGVTVCTPVPINDTKTRLVLRPGTHQLDGINALAYARTRATARSDLDRIDRQQQVVSALLDKALSGGTLANPARLTQFVTATLKTITVDQALAEDMLGLASQLKDVSTDDVTFATVPLANVNYRTPSGESAVLWDRPAARELFGRIATDEPLIKPTRSAQPSAAGTPTPTASSTALTIPPTRIALRVLNGTTIPGLGARTRSALIDAGFMVPSAAGNTAQRDFATTVIRYPPGRADSARTVAAAIPGAELRETNVSAIEVVVGRDTPTIRKVTVAATPSPTPVATPAARTATQNICRT